MVWLPRTAVGEGDDAGRDGEGEAAGLPDGVADVDGDPDCAADGEADAAADGEDGDVPCVNVADGLVALARGLEVAGLAAGRSAIDPVDDAANTAAPSATRARRAAIGTSPIRLPRGESCRQLGQKPETGVKT